MKSFIISVLSMSLFFQPSAGALTLAQQAKVKEFFEKTELTKKEVSLHDFVLKVSPGLSPKVLAEVKAFEAQNPGLVLPKMSVSKVIGKNGEEDIQVSFVGKNNQGVPVGSMSFQIVGRGKVFAQVGGAQINFDDLQSMAQVMVKINQGMDPHFKAGYKAKNFGVLTARDTASLNLEQKRKYFKNLRELIGTLEELENQQLDAKAAKSSLRDPQGEKSNTSVYASFVAQLINQAEAKPELSYNAQAVANIKVGSNANSCVYAGYVTNYGYKADGSVYDAAKDKKVGHYACGGAESSFDLAANKCKSSSGGIRCNPAIYGSEPEVCAREHSRSATAECNAKATQYDAFPKSELKQKDQAGFDQLMKSVVEKLKTQEATCAEVSKDKKDRLEDQRATCEVLSQRIFEIKQVTCETLSASPKGKFKDLKCSGSPVPDKQAPVGQVPPASDTCVADSSPSVGADGAAGPKPGASQGPGSSSKQPCKKDPGAGAGGAKDSGKGTDSSEPVSTAPGDCNSAEFSKDKGYIAAVESDCIKTGGKIVECIDLKSADKTKAVSCQCDKPAATTYAGTNLVYFCAGSPPGADAGGGKESGKKGKAADWEKPALYFAGGLLALIIGDSIFKSNNPPPSNNKPADWAPSTTLPASPHTRSGTN